MTPSADDATPDRGLAAGPVNAPASELGPGLGPAHGDSPPGADPAEAAAWADVLAGWDDEARHRAYLARFADLEGLAAAGRRYREVLLARPGDAIAARFRDEVLKRAVASGLASLPRLAPELPRARLAVRVAAGVVIGALLLAAGVLAVRLLPLLSSGARP